MTPEQEQWIVSWMERNEAVKSGGYGLCREAAKDMVEAFPDLKAVSGHVECIWGRWAHWWTVNKEGQIIDPTAGQFIGGIFHYDEYREGDPVRLGKCINCGEEIWGSGPEAVYSVYMCDQKCALEFGGSFEKWWER